MELTNTPPQTVRDLIEQYDSLTHDPNASPQDIDRLKGQLLNLGVHEAWLEKPFSDERFNQFTYLTQISPFPLLRVKDLVYAQFNKPQVYTREPPTYHEGPLLAEIIASPQDWVDDQKKALKGAALKAAGVWVGLSSPVAVDQLAPLLPLIPVYNATVPKYKRAMRSIRRTLFPYVEPGAWLQYKIKQLERQVIFSVVPGVVTNILLSPAKVSLFGDYTEIDLESGIQYKVRGAFRPTYALRRKLIAYYQERALQHTLASHLVKATIFSKAADRLKAPDKQGRRRHIHSVIGALIMIIIADLIAGAVTEFVKRWIADRIKEGARLRAFVRRFQKLKFLGRASNVFSIPTLAGAIIGSAFGPVGTIVGAGLGTTFSIYRDLGNWKLAKNQPLKLEMDILRQREQLAAAGAPPEWVKPLSSWERLRLRLYKPAELFGRYRWLPRSGPTAALIGYSVASLSGSPQLGALAGFGWYAWQDLRPWLVEKALNQFFSPPAGSGYGRGWQAWLRWMEDAHPYRLRAFRSLRAGTTAGGVTTMGLIWLGVPWPIALGIGTGVGVGWGLADFGARIGWLKLRESRFARLFGLGSRAGGAIKFVGGAIHIVGGAADVATALHGSDTGTFFGFKTIPGTNFGLGGPAGQTMNLGLAVMGGATIGATIGSLIPGIGTVFGGIIGGFAAGTLYSINYAIREYTGKGIIGWSKVGVKKWSQLPKPIKMLTISGIPVVGQLAVLGWIAHDLGLGKAIAGAWHWSKNQPVIGPAARQLGEWGTSARNALSSIGNWFKDKAGKGADKVVDKLTEGATKFWNFISAVAGGIIQLLIGGDLAEAAVSIAIGLALLGVAINTTNISSSLMAQDTPITTPPGVVNQFIDVVKSADPQIIANNDLPKTINFKVFIRAKSSKLTNITCKDELTIATKDGRRVNLPANFPANECPQSLQPGETKTIEFQTLAENTDFFKDSIITNTFTIDFDVEGSVLGLCGKTSGFANLLPNPIPESAGAASPNDFDILERGQVIQAAEFGAEKSGVPCEVLIGIHYVEAGWDSTQSFIDGTLLVQPHAGVGAESCNNYGGRMIPGEGCVFDLENTAWYAGDHVKDEVLVLRGGGSIEKNWVPPANFDEMIGALSLYNGGGNANCGEGVPYTGPCPPPTGIDDTYVMTHFDSEHATMYLIYCEDRVKCDKPPIFERDGAATAAKEYYLKELRQND